ncbi:S1 family peptidase [Corynebacterium sp. 32222D000AT]
MLRIPHLKKVLVSSAFAGAFFFAAPAAGAQEAPQPGFDAAAAVDQVRSDLADWGISAPEVDPQVTDAVTEAVNQHLPQGPQAQQAAGQAAAAATAPQTHDYADAPATNPNPIGLEETVRQATQPEFKPQNVDPNYQWRNDMFSKVMAGKPTKDFILHRVPGSYFDAPQVPEESNAALTEGKSLYGPGTPIYVNDEAMCTLTAAGTDNAGRKVGLTAGHCGEVGQPVASADSWQVGPSGTIVDKNAELDYSVVEFGANAEVSRTYNGVTANRLGGNVKPGDISCKRGLATGDTCGMTLTTIPQYQFTQVCAMQGDSGAPLFNRGRLVGSVTGGINPPGFNGACRTPLQGAVHVPTAVTNMDAILADLNRRGGVGAGFSLPEN